MATSRTYRHRIVFRRPIETTDDSGQVIRTFETAFPRRAMVTQPAAEIGDVAGQKQTAAEFNIELPFDSELNTIEIGTWQVLWLDTSQAINLTSIWTDKSSRRQIAHLTGTLDK